MHQGLAGGTGDAWLPGDTVAEFVFLTRCAVKEERTASSWCRHWERTRGQTRPAPRQEACLSTTGQAFAREHVHVGILKKPERALSAQYPFWGLAQKPVLGMPSPGKPPLTGGNSLVVGAKRECQSSLSDPPSAAF